MTPVQKAICGQHVFRHTFGRFLQIFSDESSQAAGVTLFEDYPEVRAGFVKYTTPPFSQQPIFDSELIDWFIKLLQLFEENFEGIDFSIAERFSCFAKATGLYNFGVEKLEGY